MQSQSPFDLYHAACTTGTLEEYKKIYAEYPDDRPTIFNLETACRNNQFEIMEWILSENLERLLTYSRLFKPSITDFYFHLNCYIPDIRNHYYSQFNSDNEAISYFQRKTILFLCSGETFSLITKIVNDYLSCPTRNANDKIMLLCEWCIIAHREMNAESIHHDTFNHTFQAISQLAREHTIDNILAAEMREFSGKKIV